MTVFRFEEFFEAELVRLARALYLLWVAPMDGSEPIEIGGLPAGACERSCNGQYLAWSPDGSRIAFGTSDDDGAVISAIAADGSGDAEPIDELTYSSWTGGGYACNCA